MTEPQRYRINPDGSSYAALDKGFAKTMGRLWKGFSSDYAEGEAPLKGEPSVMTTMGDRAEMTGNLLSLGYETVKRFGQYAGLVPPGLKETYSELDKIPELGPMNDKERQGVDAILSLGAAGMTGLFGMGKPSVDIKGNPLTLNISHGEGYGMLAAGARRTLAQGASREALREVLPGLFKGLGSIPAERLVELDKVSLHRLLANTEGDPKDVLGRFLERRPADPKKGTPARPSEIEFALDPLARQTDPHQEAVSVVGHEVTHKEHAHPSVAVSPLQRDRHSKITLEARGEPDYVKRPTEKAAFLFEEHFAKMVEDLPPGERLSPERFTQVFDDTMDAIYTGTEAQAVKEKEVPFRLDQDPDTDMQVYLERLEETRDNLAYTGGTTGEYLKGLNKAEAAAFVRAGNESGLLQRSYRVPSKRAADKAIEDLAVKYYKVAEDKELQAIMKNLDEIDFDGLTLESRGKEPLDLLQTSRVPTKGDKLFRPYFRFPRKETSKFSGREFTHGKVVRRADGKFEIFGQRPDKTWEFLRFSNNPGPRIPRRFYKKKP